MNMQLHGNVRQGDFISHLEETKMPPLLARFVADVRMLAGLGVTTKR